MNSEKAESKHTPWAWHAASVLTVLLPDGHQTIKSNMHWWLITMLDYAIEGDSQPERSGSCTTTFGVPTFHNSGKVAAQTSGGPGHRRRRPPGFTSHLRGASPRSRRSDGGITAPINVDLMGQMMTALKLVFPFSKKE